jgi:hypothetical protein
MRACESRFVAVSWQPRPPPVSAMHVRLLSALLLSTAVSAGCSDKASELPDADGDGSPTSEDCNDEDASV